MLQLSFNDAQDMGAAALASVIRFLERLRVLDFSGNRCGVEGGRALGQMLAGDYMPACRELLLSTNADDPLFAHEVCSALAAGQNKGLEVLDLGGNGMNKAGMRFLSDGLRTRCCPHLRSLCIATL